MYLLCKLKSIEIDQDEILLKKFIYILFSEYIYICKSCNCKCLQRNATYYMLFGFFLLFITFNYCCLYKSGVLCCIFQFFCFIIFFLQVNKLFNDFILTRSNIC